MFKKLDKIASRPLSIALVLAVGCGLRVAHYFYNRALWRDEASLWKSIANLPWSGLAGPLYNDEESPLGFLVAQKATLTLLGDGERSLRFVPFLAGILGLFLFWRLARRLVQPPWLPLGVLLFAIAYSPVYYSAELKPYSVDLAFATLLQLIAVKGVDEQKPGRTAVALALLGAASLWFSFQSVFILAGTAGTFLILAWSKRDRRWLWAALLPGCAWIVSLAAFFFVSLARILENQPMLAAWTQHFWPVLPRSLEDVLWLPRHLYLLFRVPGDQPVVVAFIALALAVAGVLSFWRARDLRLGLLILPIALPLVPSAIKAYPYFGRHLLFALPALLILLVRGLEWIARLQRPMAAPRIAQCLGLGVLASSAWVLASTFPERLHRDDVRPLMSRLEHDATDGVLYVYHGARKGFEYYSRRYDLRRMKSIVVGTREPADVLRLDGAGNVWVLVIRVPDVRFDNWPAFAERLEQVGDCTPYQLVTDADRTVPGAVGLYRCSL